jgi:hypothetical protein
MCSVGQRQHCEAISVHVDRIYPSDDGREAETCQGYMRINKLHVQVTLGGLINLYNIKLNLA